MPHTRRPILRVFEIIPSYCCCWLWDIPRSVAIVLGVNKLLVMAKDTSGLCPIAIGEAFFNLLVVALSYNFEGHFKNTYPPINLEYQPLEVVKPSLLAFEPSSTYTLIRP